MDRQLHTPFENENPANPASHHDDSLPIVLERNGQTAADSRDVAAYFEKEHRNVLRDIRDLREKEPSFGALNFEPFKINDLTGESTSHYEMTRDGFMLLVMGFTGEKALRLKLKYIAQFNAMEAQIARLSNTQQTMTAAELFMQSAQAMLEVERRQVEQARALSGVNNRLKQVEDTAALKVKPQNTETISEVRTRINKKYGLPPRIIDFVVTKSTMQIRPFGMVKNSHENAQGSSFAVFQILDVSNAFKRFVSECEQVTATTCIHREIDGRFKLVKGGAK